MSIKLNKIFSETPSLNVKQLTYIPNHKSDLTTWSDGLLHLELGEAAKQIFTTLLELRSLHIDDFTRFSILELIQENLSHILTSLEQHYLSNSLLDTKRDQQIADLVLELKAHHALVYYEIFKRTHHTLETTKFSIFDFNGKKKLNQLRKQSAFLTLDKFTHLLYSLQLLYLDTPKLFWCSAYTIFHTAHKLEFDTEHVNLLLNAESPINTVEKAFSQLILASILNNHKLRQAEMRDLIQFIKYWTDLIKISEVSDQHSQYTFNYFSDQSPKFFFKNEYFDKESYYININMLISYIDSTLQPNARYYSTLEERNFSNVLKHHIQATLDPNNIRQSPRFSDEGNIELALGITSAHFFLSSARHFKETLQIEDHSQTQTPSLSHLIADKEIQLSTRTHEQRFNAEITKIYSTGIVNHSDHGYCLNWHESTPRYMRAGEFILTRENAQSPWNGAIIRWLKNNNEQSVEFGVELFSKKMCPVAVCIPKPNSQPIYHPAILIAEDQSRYSIILPSGQIFTEDQNLLLRLDKTEIKMFLTRSTLLTQSCAKFMFDLLEQSKYPILNQYFEEHLNKLNTKDLWDSLK